MKYTKQIDPSTIPLEVLIGELNRIPAEALYSQVARLRNAQRVTHSGGSIWGHHNPKTARCRCKACNRKRAKKLGKH